MDVMIGVDLGGTYTKFGLVNEKGELIAENSIKTDTSVNYTIFFERLFDEIKKMQHGNGYDSELKGIGVGAPSGNYLSGKIENASNLSWPNSIPVAKVLSEYSGLPVAVTNDANATAFGEMKFGIAKNVMNFISLTLGTGLGCGIVANGRLVTGHDGHAGELGHTIAVVDGRSCGCGRNGCLETYASASGIVRTLHYYLEKTDLPSIFREADNRKISAKEITEAARDGDEMSIEVINKTGQVLGKKLADTAALLSPSLIVLSGGLANSGSLILEPTRKYFENSLLEIYKNTISIEISEMSKKNAAILGAAAMMWEQDFSNLNVQYI